MPRLWHRNVSYFREIINTYKNQNRETTIDSKQKAILIAKLASQKKAEEIVILDMKKISNLCDYFIICHASSDRKVKAIAQGIDEGLEEINTKVW
nr:RsfS/YbeB/iojap family protein [Bacteroidota bacterium]